MYKFVFKFIDPNSHHNNDDHIDIISKLTNLTELDQSDIQSLSQFSKTQLISIIKSFNSNIKYINDYIVETTQRQYKTIYKV